MRGNCVRASWRCFHSFRGSHFHWKFLNMACAYRERRPLRSSWFRKICNTSTARHEYDDAWGLDTVRFVVR